MSALESMKDSFERMLLIRRFEEGMLRLHRRRLLPCHFHVSIGQEATAVAVCRAAEEHDVLFTNHRSNGHLIARGADPGWMFAEQLGRVGGNTNGKGGTLHMIAPELGMPWTTSLVGCVVPLAVGAALVHKQQRRPGVVIAFFGDGVMEEGAFYEGINLAALWQVPLVCVCENNGVPAELRGLDTTQPSTFLARRLADIPSAFGIPCATIDGADVEGLSDLMTEVVGTVRRNLAPYFVEVRTTRYPGNRALWPELAGAETDLGWAWDDGEPPEELAAWSRHSDPLMGFVRRLAGQGAISRDEATRIDAAIAARIDEAMESAIGSPHPPPDSAYRDVWAGQETSS